MATIGEGNNNSGSTSTWTWTWTWEQNKAFEIGVAVYPEGFPNRWEKIAAHIPGIKTMQEVKIHYQMLLDDLNLIESGSIPLPYYSTPDSSKKEKNDKGWEWETRKGRPWTQEEHKQFLLGMDKYGKGDWKNISKEFVKTRTPTQVASHAQKHFKRQEKKDKEGKRRSIFDITDPNDRPEGKSSSRGAKGKDLATYVNNEKVSGNGEGISQVYDIDEPPSSPPESWFLGEDDMEFFAHLRPL